MASFDFCIDQTFKAGRITKDVAERLKQADDVDGELTNIVANLSRQKREIVIQTVKLSKAWENASGHKRGSLAGINSMLSVDVSGKAGYQNIDLLSKSYQAEYQAQVADMLQHFRTRALGFYQNEAELQKLIKAIYGEDVGDPQLMKFANDWHTLNEKMRSDFNAMGGSISKNDRYLLPQHHDARSIIKLGKERGRKLDIDLALRKWKERIIPFLDRSQMTDDAGKPLSDTEFNEALDYTFDSIITNGANKTEILSPTKVGKKLSRKHSERRFLYFKNADSWMEYQKDFGRGDIFSTITDHIHTMSHDIALMEVLGPSPENTYKALISMAEKTEKGLKPLDRAYSNALYNVVSGKVNGGDMLTLADFSGAMTNILVASTLGKAFLSALSDTGFQAIESSYRGLPIFRSIGNQLKLMTNEDMQVFAVKTGLMADGMIGRFHAANRHADVYGVGATAKVSEGVMRLSLLEPWTNAGRWGFGMSYQQELAENFGKRFSSLDQKMIKAFNEYGINENDWDAFRKTEAMNYKGVAFADLTKGRKFSMLVHGETDFAIPSPDARVRAITTGGIERASIGGQLWRSGMMLKTFPIGVMMTHMARAGYQATTADKVKYLAAIAAATTTLGGLSLQMKDLASGRDPREMFDNEGLPIFDDKFLSAAFMQGGGLGIFGDLVFSDHTRFGQTFTETVLGPKFGMVNDTAKLIQVSAGGIHDAVASGQTNVLGDLVQYVDRYTPDVWQTHLFMNAFFDQMELLADPKAAKRFNRQTRKRRNDFDQEYWWKPGEIAPDRAPDLGAAIPE